MLSTTVFPLVFLALFSGPLTRELAYLDPGSGSFILQMILAALLGGLFVFRSYLAKVKNFITGKFSHKENEEE